MDIKGYTYGYGAKKGMYEDSRAVKSRKLLADTGINWVCLAFSVKQKSFSSTEILYDYAKNMSDLEIISTVQDFHTKGIKVCLKPMIDSEDGVWRALIDFPDMDMMGKDQYWDKWFAAYKAFLVHYAEIAAFTDCEMLCVGCEMLGTERKEKHWRETIAAVKNVYKGKLVYNTNHGKEEVANWVDMLDYLGTSAYYPVAPKVDEMNPKATSLEYMTAEWTKIAERLEKVSKKTGKPILFMEIGCRSAAGCASMPWDFTHQKLPISEEEQANFYESSLSVMTKQPWFAGYFWWDWSTFIYDDKETAKQDSGFNVHLKKAEDVIKKWYR